VEERSPWLRDRSQWARPALAEVAGFSRSRHVVTSLGPGTGRHEAIEGLGVRTSMLDSSSRRQLPQAVARLAKQHQTVITEEPFQGGKPGDPTAFRTPLFPAFLALFYRIFGVGTLTPRRALAGLSVATVVLVASVGSRLQARFFRLSWDDPQRRAIERRHPGIRAMSELTVSRIWFREGLRCLAMRPGRMPWLLVRKTDEGYGFYRDHYALVPTIVLMLAGGGRPGSGRGGDTPSCCFPFRSSPSS
jgi:hypothetical protein